MTVEELIDILKWMPMDTEVWYQSRDGYTDEIVGAEFNNSWPNIHSVKNRKAVVIR